MPQHVLSLVTSSCASLCSLNTHTNFCSSLFSLFTFSLFSLLSLLSLSWLTNYWKALRARKHLEPTATMPRLMANPIHLCSLLSALCTLFSLLWSDLLSALSALSSLLWSDLLSALCSLSLSLLSCAYCKLSKFSSLSQKASLGLPHIVPSLGAFFFYLFRMGLELTESLFESDRCCASRGSVLHLETLQMHQVGQLNWTNAQTHLLLLVFCWGRGLTVNFWPFLAVILYPVKMIGQLSVGETRIKFTFNRTTTFSLLVASWSQNRFENLPSKESTCEKSLLDIGKKSSFDELMKNK